MRPLLALLVLAVLAVFVLASEHSARAGSDLELWSDVGLRHKLNKKWRLDAGQGLRFDDSISRFSKSTTEVSATFRANRWLRLSGIYRFTYRHTRADNYKVRHRFAFEGKAKHRRGKLRGSYRLRLQEQIRGFGGGDGTRLTLRNRVKISWEAAPKWTPYGSVELFHLDTPNNGWVHTKTRLTLGTSRDLKKDALDLFYRLEVPTDSAELTVHILGVGYTFGM